MKIFTIGGILLLFAAGTGYLVGQLDDAADDAADDVAIAADDAAGDVVLAADDLALAADDAAGDVALAADAEAEDVTDSEATTSETAVVETTDAAAEEQLREAMARLAPDMEITAISESVMPGVYELISGAQVYYLTPDGRYMLEGSVIDLENRVDISEQRRGSLQMSVINQVPEDQMVVFNNEQGDAERSITVFTDSDCGFCQKLHREIDAITDANIKVRYLLFPRAGIDSVSSHELESVWCSDDPQEAMTIAKSGGQVPPLTCENPIETHMGIARQVGLRGTPLIYLDNGTKIPGYQPAAQLIQQIQNSEPMSVGG